MAHFFLLAEGAREGFPAGQRVQSVSERPLPLGVQEEAVTAKSGQGGEGLGGDNAGFWTAERGVRGRQGRGAVEV